MKLSFENNLGKKFKEHVDIVDERVDKKMQGIIKIIDEKIETAKNDIM